MADHRAEGRATTRSRTAAATSAPPTPGSRADRPAAPGPSARRALLPGLRTLVGGVAVAVAAVGAVVAGSSALGAPLGASLGPSMGSSLGTSGAAATSLQQVGASQAPGTRGGTTGGATGRTSTAAIKALVDSRERAVSRDSARQLRAAVEDRNLERTAEAKADARQTALAHLETSAEKRGEEIAHAWVLPVAGYHLTARFGQCSGLWSSCHTGLDFAAPAGTPLRSIASGRVTEAGYDGSYGNKTVVTLEDGTELWYCHQTTIAVARGESVTSGQVIGSVGSTGNTTGPHLHLEVHPGAGDAVDPAAALTAHGVRP